MQSESYLPKQYIAGPWEPHLYPGRDGRIADGCPPGELIVSDFAKKKSA